RCGQGDAMSSNPDRESAEDAVLAPCAKVPEERLTRRGPLKLRRRVGPVPAPLMNVAELTRPRLEIARLAQHIEVVSRKSAEPILVIPEALVAVDLDQELLDGAWAGVGPHDRTWRRGERR